MLFKEGSHSSRIDIVFDTYRDMSIKDVEQTLRGDDQGIQLQNISETQLAKQWKKFLLQSYDKASLIQFLLNVWKKHKYTDTLVGKCLYVTTLDKCWKITQGCCEEVPATSIQHEEVHARLVFHAAHASREGFEAVVICADDTDVFILCLAFRDNIHASLFQKCGIQTRTRFIYISNAAASFGPDVCKALLGMYVFIGCDTLRAFVRKGNIRALTILNTNAEFKEEFAQLGVHWNIPPNLQLISYLHVKTVSESIIIHANYQAAIWRRSLINDPETPDPVGNGWKLKE